MYKKIYENISEEAKKLNIDFRKWFIEVLEEDGQNHITKFEITEINREKNFIVFTCWTRESDYSESLKMKISGDAKIRDDLVVG